MIIAAGLLEEWRFIPILLMLMLIVAGGAMLVRMVVAVFLPSELPKMLHAYLEYSREACWPTYFAELGFLIFFGAFVWRQGEPISAVCCACLGLLRFGAMIHSIYQRRVQWGIKGLFVVTLIVGVCCSLLATIGWPIVAILAALFGAAFMLQWVATW